jgi:hypothetical protein
MKCILCIQIRGFVEHSSCRSGTPKAAQKGKFFKDICDLKLEVCKVVLFFEFLVDWVCFMQLQLHSVN